MDASRFDTLIRALTDGPIARRAFTRGLAGTALAACMARWSGEDLHARKRRNPKKRKKQNNKPPVNEFGCRNVGVVCTSANQCCSGICEGKRRKKGKKSKKTCRAHDAGGCRVEDGACLAGPIPCLTTTGEEGFCEVTTGNAPYCAKVSFTFACTKDADCVRFCGPLAACGLCAFPGEEEFQFCAGPSGCSAP